MARENVGHIDCPLCKKEAPVRKDKNGGLYINCPIDGLIQPKLEGGQSYILENTRWLGNAPAKKAAPASDPAPKDDDDKTQPNPKPPRSGPAQPKAETTPPAAPPAPAKKKGGFLDDLLP